MVRAKKNKHVHSDASNSTTVTPTSSQTTVSLSTDDSSQSSLQSITGMKLRPRKLTITTSAAGKKARTRQQRLKNRLKIKSRRIPTRYIKADKRDCAMVTNVTIIDGEIVSDAVESVSMSDNDDHVNVDTDTTTNETNGHNCTYPDVTNTSILIAADELLYNATPSQWNPEEQKARTDIDPLNDVTASQWDREEENARVKAREMQINSVQVGSVCIILIQEDPVQANLVQDNSAQDNSVQDIPVQDTVVQDIIVQDIVVQANVVQEDPAKGMAEQDNPFTDMTSSQLDRVEQQALALFMQRSSDHSDDVFSLPS